MDILGWRRGHAVHLWTGGQLAAVESRKAARCLCGFLLRHRADSSQGEIQSANQLLRSIWEPEYGTELDYLRSFVKALRKKIEMNPSEPRYIVTEPWVGYRLCDPHSGKYPAAQSN